MRSHLVLLVLAAAGVVSCAGEGSTISQEGEQYSGWASLQSELLSIDCLDLGFQLEVDVDVSVVIVEIAELTEPLSVYCQVYAAAGSAPSQTVERGVPQSFAMGSVGHPAEGLRLSFLLPSGGTAFTGRAVVTLSNQANPKDKITYTLEFSRPCDEPEPELTEEITTCCEGHDVGVCEPDVWPGTPDGAYCICGEGEQPPPVTPPGLPPPPPGPPVFGGVFCVQDMADGTSITSIALPSAGRCSAVLEKPGGGHNVLIGTQSAFLVTEIVPGNPDYLGAFGVSSGTIPDMRQLSHDEALVVNATTQTASLLGYTAGLLDTLSYATVPNALSADRVPGGGYFVLAGTPTLKLYFGDTLDTAAMVPVADCGAGASFVRCNGDYVGVTNYDEDTCYLWSLDADGEIESPTPIVIPTGDGPWKLHITTLPDGSTACLVPDFLGDSVTGIVLKDGEAPEVTTVPMEAGSKPVHARLDTAKFTVDVLENGMRRVSKVDALEWKMKPKE